MTEAPLLASGMEMMSPIIDDTGKILAFEAREKGSTLHLHEHSGWCTEALMHRLQPSHKLVRHESRDPLPRGLTLQHLHDRSTDWRAPSGPQAGWRFP